jgi:hypothetical protein
MKTLFISALCLFLAFYAADTFSESDEICSTWVNLKYTSAGSPQKLIVNYDGTLASYSSIASKDALKRGTYFIKKKWEDSVGNKWYQIQGFLGGGEYGLARISNNGKTLEYVFKDDKFPVDIKPNDTSYRKYTRD